MEREWWDRNIWSMFLNFLDRISSVINMVVSRRIAGMCPGEEAFQTNCRARPELTLIVLPHGPHLSCKKVGWAWARPKAIIRKLDL